MAISHGRIAHANRAAHHCYIAAALLWRTLHVETQFAVLNLRMREHLIVGVDRRVRDAEAAEFTLLTATHETQIDIAQLIQHRNVKINQLDNHRGSRSGHGYGKQIL